MEENTQQDRLPCNIYQGQLEEEAWNLLRQRIKWRHSVLADAVKYAREFGLDLDLTKQLKQLKEQKELERGEGWKNKPLHGQFLRQTEEIRDDATWD